MNINIKPTLRTEINKLPLVALKQNLVKNRVLVNITIGAFEPC